MVSKMLKPMMLHFCSNSLLEIFNTWNLWAVTTEFFQKKTNIIEYWQLPANFADYNDQHFVGRCNKSIKKIIQKQPEIYESLSANEDVISLTIREMRPLSLIFDHERNIFWHLPQSQWSICDNLTSFSTISSCWFFSMNSHQISFTKIAWQQRLSHTVRHLKNSYGTQVHNKKNW